MKYILKYLKQLAHDLPDFLVQKKLAGSIK